MSENESSSSEHNEGDKSSLSDSMTSKSSSPEMQPVAVSTVKEVVKAAPKQPEIPKDILARLQVFDTSGFDVFPQGLVDFMQIIASAPVKCTHCKTLYASPHSLACGHSFCPQCLIQAVSQLELNQPVPIPHINDLVDATITCPVCKTPQKCYYNKPLHEAVHFFALANPSAVCGAEEFGVEKASCYCCKKDIVYTQKQKEHADDEESEQLEFITCYCTFCKRHCCDKCIKETQIDQYCDGMTQMKRVIDWSPEDVEKILSKVPQDFLTTMNKYENAYLIGNKSTKVIWAEFIQHLANLHFLPLKLYVGAVIMIDVDQYVCQRCIPSIFDVAAKFIRSCMRNEKPVCLCGSGCKQQFYSDEHAEQFQHFGKGSRGDQTFSLWG